MNFLDRVWEAYQDSTIRTADLQRRLDLSDDDASILILTLEEMADNGNIRAGYRCKRISEQSYKLIKATASASTQGDSNPPKGLPLPDPEESLTGANTAVFDDQPPENEDCSPKWTAADYPDDNGKPKNLLNWKPPRLDLFPTTDTEADTLHALKDAFASLLPYKDNSTFTGMESQAIDDEALVEIPTPIPPGYIAFLENTAERCTSPDKKHKQAGMNRAKEWVQRIDTPERMFERLTRGYGISMMFGERFHQFIRNGHNWRGASGIMLDIDLFRDDDHPTAPEPVYSMDALFDRFPFIPRLCRYVIPSASSLHEGRPFKGRGIILFPEPITDKRVYRAIGDSLLAEIDCMLAGVTHNPCAVGFGNTHNAPQAYDNPTPDDAWIQEAVERAKATVLQEAHEIRANRERQRDRNPSAHNGNDKGKRNGAGAGGIEGENITEFIRNCDAIAEMVKQGWLTQGIGSEYKWHQASSNRSCEVVIDTSDDEDGGTIKIFSGTMTDASPGHKTPVQAHRFYLYNLTGLDLHKDSEKNKCREYLFSIGYGTDPNGSKAYTPPRHKPLSKSKRRLNRDKQLYGRKR